MPSAQATAIVPDSCTIDLQDLYPRIDKIISEGVASHYTQYSIKKRNGRGYRTISAPDDELKSLQREILKRLQRYRTIYTDDWVYGFVPFRTIVDNAIHHSQDVKHINGCRQYTVKRKVLNKPQIFLEPATLAIPRTMETAKSMVRLDIARAFDSIGRTLIVNGWPKLLTLSQLDQDKLIEICTLNGVLPQGAPTSPVLLNIALRPFDQYAIGLIKKKVTEKLGLEYTIKYSRFADDITISCNATDGAKLCIPLVEGVAKSFGLEIKRKKTRLMKIGTGLFVNGINIVNAKTHISVSRAARAKVRAAIHQASLEQDPHLFDKLKRSVIGRITYINSLDRVHGTALLSYAISKGVLDSNQKIMGMTIELKVLSNAQYKSDRTKYYKQELSRKPFINH